MPEAKATSSRRYLVVLRELWLFVGCLVCTGKTPILPLRINSDGYLLLNTFNLNSDQPL